MTSPSSTVPVGFMGIVTHCHGAHVRSLETDCQQCRRAAPALAAAPVSCGALPADSTTVLPAPLRFLPLHSQADASTDPSTALGPTDIASDYLEVPVPPFPQCEATPASSTHTVNTWSQILGVTAEPTSISLDDIREPQSLDDNLQPVTQSLSEDEKPPQDKRLIVQKRHLSSSVGGLL